MKLEIKKIRIGELEDFATSQTYRDLENVPISPTRVKSYINNPNARKNDVALLLGYHKNKLVAYRSLFAGSVNGANEKIRFAWCSGNWVHPEFRRKGFSQKLLEKAGKEWDGKLMFTNYAPESEKLYLKSGKFRPIHQFHGVRAYLFPKTRKLLSVANKNRLFRIIFLAVDLAVALVSGFRIYFFRQKKEATIQFELLSQPDDLCYKQLQDKNLNLFFGRDEKELRWIFNFPWLSSKNKPIKEKYQFSSFSESFYYRTIKIFRGDEFLGFFIFSVKDGHLKTLYFSLEQNTEELVVAFIKKYSVENKIEIVTIYNSPVARRLFERKFPFLHVKKYGQKIYSSFEIQKTSNIHFQDGDGDVIFT